MNPRWVSSLSFLACLGVVSGLLSVFMALPTSRFLCNHGTLTRCTPRVFLYSLSPRPSCISPLSLGPHLAGWRWRAVPSKRVAV